MTYILQCCSVALMLMAIYMGHRAVLEHNSPMVVFNIVIWSANMALFLFQQHIRTRNKGR